MIPLPYTAGVRTYTPAAPDAHNNPAETYAAPVEVAAIWWPGGSSEPAVPGHDRVIVDLVLVVASTTSIGPYDRVMVGGKEFEVIGYPEDFDHGPWWQPGCTPVNLRAVEA
ncbi:hypothetical protein [Rhodococcus jostii]|uniref:hypothetical protein n=1 Tax=Rhodococcus jostii TaxID=132919 RepID=UPI003644A472